MKLDGESIEVFAKSEMSENPYKVGDREKLYGLYCNTVIETHNKLLVPNALKDINWMNNPDVKLGMIAYLGFPIYLPNNSIFGTICVLDNNENCFPKEIEQLLEQIKEIIELDIEGYLAFESKSIKLETKVLEQIQIIDQAKTPRQKLSNKVKKEHKIQESITNNNQQLIDKLVEGESKDADLFNKLNSAIVMFSPVFGSEGELIDATYLDMNPMNEQLIGYKKEEVIGKSILEIFPETSPKWFRTFGPIFKGKSNVNFEMFHKPLGKHFSVNAFPIDDGSFCVNYFDISKQVILKENSKENQLLLSSIFNRINVAIVLFKPIFNQIHDLIDLEYIDMNPLNEQIMDFKLADVKGKTVLELFPNTNKEFFGYFNTSIQQKRIVPFNFKIDSSKKFYHSNAFMLDDNRMVYTCYDITEQILATKKMEEREKRHKAIFNNSSSSIVLIDSDSGAILDGNDALVRYTGYSKKTLLKMNLKQISTSSEEEIQKQLYLAKQNKKHFDFKHTLASGEIRNIEAYVGQIEMNGKMILHCTVHDITDKKNALQDVLKLSNAVEQSPASIIITDTHGNIEYTNPKNCEITGYSAENLKGKNPRILKSGKLAEHTYKDLWNTILAGGKWEGEFYNRKKNGNYYWEHASISPIKNEEGTTINFMKIGKDISEQKKIQSELRKAKFRAEENDRLKTAFLANLSHEIRTPLNGIMGFTDLILHEETPDDAKKDYQNIVKESGEQLLMIINDLVNISQIEAGELNIKLSHFSATDLLDEILLFYKPEVSKKGLEIQIVKINCQVIKSGINCMLFSDRKRLRQVFDNLIKNAIKFTQKGTITLGIECRDYTVLFTIQDTGIGISKENQKLIFDRFRQVEEHFTRHYGGNGLGLSISKEITELLGGELWVESDLGKGSKFSFTVANNS
ncbi:PAS domain-containing sensor histidine kinase [Labilibaculum antarcticum]|uniref:histidine kinase n=2 Tax=Labilibaculum antarcticum TaxID=1717717 RepID=A0A1Y1CM83_9BACT|nr:PAS domain-containing sensor histidine kinase [Labilibaculum antarcticum]